ncbi:glucose dehydrogenase [FAD, quinone]-like [Pseudomyrmex gracilis]|uniref:glucose dehydrogenase [FAD, quinone]-like n=1 Tax=Pseudomyrmex gracilis TaxID=219809 RepID=UPI00099596F3|nr:glucose dehydrogenase [FAD, quinone]-like [Pseudomyrmex gracilis]
MLHFFYYLSIIAMTVPIESNNVLRQQYISVIDTIVNLNIGFLKFLNEGQHMLNKETPNMTPQHNDVYDFIVVGAGTAGATVAARLSENPAIKVLLIEAGSNENYLMDVPALAPYLQLSDVNWKYYTKPSDKYCLGMKNNKCHFPRGKVMGGSSAINYMIASRGTAEDYDRWAAMGNEGWAYKDVLKYFKKLETIDIPHLQSDTTYHGTNGPVHISQSPFRTPLADIFLQAGQELGYTVVDYNAENVIGFAYPQTIFINNTRMSSNRAYLHPIRDRKNLYVTRNSMVSKVLIDRRANRAIGVQFIKADQTISVFASKEIILCAGAIGSPQLLMLSGIGPFKHLTDLGIDVIRDAPVGENLMDHVSYSGLAWRVNEPLSIREQDYFRIFRNSYIMDFLLNNTGPLTSPGGIDALAFINTKQPEKHNGSPDIELMLFNFIVKSYHLSWKVLNLKNEVSQLMRNFEDNHGWSILPMLLKPKSRGRIRLLANDINVKPEINPNYYDDPEDVRTMINGIKAAINIANTKSMQAFNPQFLRDICEQYTFDSYAYWECAIRTLSVTIYHLSGTCKMAPRTDPTAVVDPKLKVVGIKRLRVVDASIMPEITSGHITLPVYMIAEKAADMIKKRWRL